MPSQNDFSIPHLCGGILFALLLETTKLRKSMRDRDHSGTDGLTYTDVYFGLVKVVTGADLNDPRDKGDKSKVVSEYKTCVNSKSEYNPFTKESYRSSFNSKYIKKDPAILKRTAEFIEHFLDPEKYIWFVKALIEIMQKDKAISQNTKINTDFDKSIPVSKLHESKSIRFLPFFLSVLHYVITNCPDCESGRPTFEDWFNQPNPKAKWKLKPKKFDEIDKTLGELEVSTDLGFQDIPVKNTENTHPSVKEPVNHTGIKNDSSYSAKNPLSKGDARLLPKLMKDFNSLLKFSKDTDLTTTPMPFDLPGTFDCKLKEWKDNDTDFKNPELNELKYNILNTLNAYFSFWSRHLWYDEASAYLICIKNPMEKEKLRQQVVTDRKKTTILHKRLCQYIRDFDIDMDEAETVKTTVIDETTQSGPHITIIQNQTNIGHSESKTYNLKDCNVTFND